MVARSYKKRPKNVVKKSRRTVGKKAWRKKVRPSIVQIAREVVRNQNLSSKIKRIVHNSLPVGVYVRHATGQLRLQSTIGQVDYFYGTTYQNRLDPPGDTYSMSWLPFNNARVLDAASVMFNGKGKAYDGPLNVTPAVPGSFNPNDTNVDLIYGSFEVRIRNVTDHNYKMELWSFTNKSNSNTSFVSDFAANIVQEPWAGGGPTLTIPTAQVGFTCTRGVSLGQCSSNSAKYVVKKLRSVTLAPGKEFVYFTSCRNVNYDMAKFRMGDGSFAKYGKGFTQLVLRCSADLHVRYKTSGTPTDSVSNYLVSQTRIKGLVSSIKEVFKINEPENASDTGDRRAFINLIEPDPADGSGTVESSETVCPSNSHVAPAYQ